MYIHTKVECPNCESIIDTKKLICPNCGKVGSSHIVMSGGREDFICLSCKHKFFASCPTCSTDITKAAYQTVLKYDIPKVSEKLGGFKENLSLLKKHIDINLEEKLVDYKVSKDYLFEDKPYLASKVNPEELIDKFIKGVKDNPLYKEDFRQNIKRSDIAVDVKLFINTIPRFSGEVRIDTVYTTYHKYETTKVKDMNVYDAEGIRLGSYEKDVKETNTAASKNKETSLRDFYMDEESFTPKGLKVITKTNISNLLELDKDSILVYTEKDPYSFKEYYKERFENYLLTEDEYLTEVVEVERVRWNSFKRHETISVAIPIYTLTIQADKIYKVIVNEHNVLGTHDLPKGDPNKTGLKAFRDNTFNIMKGYNNNSLFIASQVSLFACLCYGLIQHDNGAHSLFLTIFSTLLVFGILYALIFFILNKVIQPNPEEMVDKALKKIDSSINPKKGISIDLKYTAVSDMMLIIDDDLEAAKYHKKLNKDSKLLKAAIHSVYSKRIKYTLIAVIEYIILGALLALEMLSITNFF